MSQITLPMVFVQGHIISWVKFHTSAIKLALIFIADESQPDFFAPKFPHEASGGVFSTPQKWFIRDETIPLAEFTCFGRKKVRRNGLFSFQRKGRKRVGSMRWYHQPGGNGRDDPSIVGPYRPPPTNVLTR